MNQHIARRLAHRSFPATAWAWHPGLMSALALMLGLGGCAQDGAGSAAGLPSLRTGRAALASGAPELSLTICSRLAAGAPNDAAPLVCAGDAAVALGRFNDADTAYTQALLRDARSTPALLGLGRLRLRDDPARAASLFRRALAITPDLAPALNDLGIAQDLQGQHSAAQDSYGAALVADPAMRAAQVNLALSLALGGKPAEAARRLIPLAAGPDASTRERHDLAAVLAMDGRVEEARLLLSPGLAGADLDAAIAGYRALLGGK